MKIYIAAPWKDRTEIALLGTRLEASGNTITHAWWDTEDFKEENGETEQLKQCALDDINGVRTSDLVLVINSAKSEGKAFEQGVAISYGKPIIIVGKRGEHSNNVFHYLPQYQWLETIEEAMKAIGLINWLISNGK